MASSIHELPQQSEIEPDLLTPIEILKQKYLPSHLVPTVSTVVHPKLLVCTQVSILQYLNECLFFKNVTYYTDMSTLLPLTKINGCQILG